MTQGTVWQGTELQVNLYPVTLRLDALLLFFQEMWILAMGNTSKNYSC